MKILLIYPYFIDERVQVQDISAVPIGVYYVGALLKENHYDVEILNWYNINKTPLKIKEILIAQRPDVIGFSIMHANRWGGIEIARIAKQIDPEVKIVFGGIGATFLWEHLLKHFKVIDYVVIGEGEYTFLNLLNCLKKNDDDDIQNVKGIAFKKGSDYIKTKSSEFIQDIDNLPVPAKYFEYQHVALSRGCPGRCTFCGSPQFWGHKVRFHSPEYFVDQLEMLYQKGIRFFYFSDDTFMLQKKRVIAICKKILKRNLNIVWVAISSVKYVTAEILAWMRKAGCIQISYGVESGSEEIRNQLNKNIKTDQIKKAFALTTRYGILARAYFIYGCAGENWSTIKETINLIDAIKPLSAIFYILDIFPGTALYSDFLKNQNSTDDIWLKQIEDMMYCESDPKLPPELILSFGKKLRTSYYENLPRFAEAIELIDKKEFYEMHSDFLSRIGMTFSHGDYAGIEAIPEKEKIAEGLFKKALDYYPNHRAYLGWATIKQKNQVYSESSRILAEGMEYFPDSEPLNICQGINYMNGSEFSKALSFFLKFKDSKEAVYYIAECYKALGDIENASSFSQKYRSSQ
ncbi:B12-binding domain-containing radical SAM protein [Desulfobacteraceae bacterium SEEP-SAG9]|nr:B12-binding domain-containing radical SAM protein [Desulfobacteraceae bacterium SEEP-SAG9]